MGNGAGAAQAQVGLSGGAARRGMGTGAGATHAQVGLSGGAARRGSGGS